MRNKIISIFVVCWLILFHYESTRHFYLEPCLRCQLPKTKFLFPPAGWIMFFNVDNEFTYAQVYGVKGASTVPLDPHQILQTRAIGYDNINRNALVSVLSSQEAGPFCRYLRRKFPYFERFTVTYVSYPSLTDRPFDIRQGIAYECTE